MNHQGLDAYLCCIVGADQYALRGDAVRLVARAEQMRTSAASDGRAGVLSVAGADVPVYGLGALLGGARDVRTADRHIVVSGAIGDPIGLLVDRVVRAPLGAARELALPAIVGDDAWRWFAGLLTLAETSCLVLNPSGLRPGAVAPAAVRHAGRRGGAMPRAVADLVFVFTSAALPPCDGARLGIHASRLTAIVQGMSAVPLPGCAHHVAGVGAWREAAVAVVDYSRGSIATRTARRFAVVRADAATLVALPINADAMLRRATAADARAAGATVPPHVRGVFQSGDERIALLDLERVARGACAPASASVSTFAGEPALV